MFCMSKDNGAVSSFSGPSQVITQSYQSGQSKLLDLMPTVKSRAGY